MRILPSLALVSAVCLTPYFAHADAEYIRDFKAVDNALVRHQTAYTGDPDVDFRKQLILRRQNIIDMAEVALSRANDPATVDFAQATIDKQKRDIAELERWLHAH